MDYLSVVSQYNDIQHCSTSSTVHSKDEASLHFLFGSPELLLLGFGVSSDDFQLSSLSLFLQYNEAELTTQYNCTRVYLCLRLQIPSCEIPKKNKSFLVEQ